MTSETQLPVSPSMMAPLTLTDTSETGEPISINGM